MTPTNDEINRAIMEIRYPGKGRLDWYPINEEWATDLNAAVGLLEGVEWQISYIESDDIYYWCEIWPNPLGSEAVADTPARAVCLAYLKSKGVEM